MANILILTETAGLRQEQSQQKKDDGKWGNGMPKGNTWRGLIIGVIYYGYTNKHGYDLADFWTPPKS